MDSSGNILVGKTSSVFNNDGIELKADDTVAAVGPTIKLTYEVMGVFGIVS